MVASLRLSFPKVEAASSHCLRLMGYSLPVRECLTLELVIRMTRPGSARGTEVASRDLSQTTKKKYMTDKYMLIYRMSTVFETKDSWIALV